jgi:putative ABC transport system substrate-binding protein
LAPGTWAQPQDKVYRIGIVSLAAAADLAGAQPASATLREFIAGMRELGHVYGEHFITVARGSEGRPERFPALAAELVAERVDLIVATGGALPSLQRATSTIPIVMAATSDPVSQGLVQSLGRPGGNVTGLSLQTVETTGKRLELLREMVPGAAPLAVLWNQNQPGVLHWHAAEAAARRRGWKLLSLMVREIDDAEDAIARAVAERAAAMLVAAAGIVFPHRARFTAQAARQRLPAMYDLRPYVDAGGLISYGPDINHVWRRAAGYADKILKGAKPGELPIEQPTKFELVINLKTAKALGLTIPQTLRLRADEVIE